MIVGTFGVSRQTYPFLRHYKNYESLERSLVQLQRSLFDPATLHRDEKNNDLAAAVENVMQPTYKLFALDDIDEHAYDFLGHF